MGTDETLPALAGPLYRFACRLTGNEADARDAVQETLAAVLEKRAAFRGPPEKFRSWVFRIAYRKAVDALRSRRRTVELTEERAAKAAAESGAPEPLAGGITREELAQAFARLPEPDQTILTLRFQDGFGNAEIARVLGVTPNHAGVLVFRAKQRLRRLLS